MPLSISIDCSDAIKRINEMRAKLRGLENEMGDELYNWEAEDLHRRRPYVARKGRRVFTYIQQHSIAEMKRGMAARQAARKLHHRGPRHWSTRPILRDELLQKLIERLKPLLETKVKW